MIAFLNYADNLLKDPDTLWPPAAIRQKIYRSEQLAAFAPEDQALLTERLGLYCDLQSINSEDAITWSFFGTLASADEESRANTLNWLMARAGLPWTDNSRCAIELWRRVAHPVTGTMGGPELDACVSGDHCVVFVEAKWKAKEGMGFDGTGQMEYRRNYLDKYGGGVCGDRGRVVLGVAVAGTIEEEVPPDSDQVATRGITWAELSECPSHPRQQEFARYYAWKERLSG